MNKKFLSAALAISLLGLCKIGFNNSVLAVRPEDMVQIRNQIFRLNGEYTLSCISGLLSQSVNPVENWRTKMLNLFNRLPFENRTRTFVQIAQLRGVNINLSNIANFSEIVRIPCPLNREYTVELIDQFLTPGDQRPDYSSNGTSILAMKVSLNNGLNVVVAI